MRKSFLFLLLLFIGAFCQCSGIDFSTNRKLNDFSVDYQTSSTLCEEEDKKCLAKLYRQGLQNKPFFKTSQEKFPGFLTEYFTITSRNKVEILFVIDASDSMSDNLTKIGQNMEPFLSYLKDKEWRIAFTTADHGDHFNSSEEEKKTLAEKWQDYSGDRPRFGQLMALEKQGVVVDQFVLNPKVSEYKQIFKDSLTRQSSSECNLPPFCHGHHEQPLRALKSAIERSQTNSVNQQFFQAGVDTIAVIVTDEDERRSDPHNATTAEDVIRTYNKVFKNKDKRLFAFSISVQDQDCFEQEKNSFLFFQSGAVFGNIVARLPQLTGGKNISLCEENYGSSLAKISKHTRHLVQSITLDKLFYIPETVKLVLFPAQPTVSWKLYGRKIVFSEDIKEGTQIKVSYQYEKY